MRTLKQAMLANCYQCMGYFHDGKVDCKLPTCTFYPWMPYREGGPRKAKRLSDEAREKLRDARIRTLEHRLSGAPAKA